MSGIERTLACPEVHIPLPGRWDHLQLLQMSCEHPPEVMNADERQGPSPLSELHLPVLARHPGAYTLGSEGPVVQREVYGHVQLGPVSPGMLDTGELCWAVRTAGWNFTAEQLEVLLSLIGAAEAETVLFQRQVRSLLGLEHCRNSITHQSPHCTYRHFASVSQPEDRARALARYVRCWVHAPEFAMCVFRVAILSPQSCREKTKLATTHGQRCNSVE
jgi:hypothetical protein